MASGIRSKGKRGSKRFSLRRMVRIGRRLLGPASVGAARPLAATEDEDERTYRPLDLTLIRRMLSWLRPYRRRYLLGVTLGVVMVLLELSSPLFVRRIIDLGTGFVADPSPILTERQAVVQLIRIIGLWGIVLGAAIVLQRATTLIMTAAGERVQFDIRRALFVHLQRLSMSYYDRTKLGRILSRCTTDLNGLRETNVWGIDIVVKNALMMLVAGGMLFDTEPRLFASVVWLAPPLFVINGYFRRRLGVAYQIAREGFTKVSANLAENITGVRIVTAFARQDWNLRAFNRLQGRNTLNNVRAARVNGIYQPTLQLFGFIGRAIILLYGAYLVTAGRVSGVGAIVAAFLYWDLFMGPVLTFGNFRNQLMLALAGAERIVNLLDTEPVMIDAPHARPLSRIEGRVRFEGVTFGYDPRSPVLHDIDFEAEPGQTVALVGPTGSGKSSIISLLARFYEPQRGRILVDDRDVREVTADSLHRQMGLVLQANFLFSGTVLENIRYVRPGATEAQVIEAAQALGSFETIRRLPDGFATVVGERGGNLSLGERQLVCFTRAFLADPRIFLLDEATSSIDAVTEQIVQRSLQRLLAGRTTFVVAHRLSTVTCADCILYLEQGRIAERGTHVELLRAGGKYAALYRQFIAPAS